MRAFHSTRARTRLFALLLLAHTTSLVASADPVVTSIAVNVSEAKRIESFYNGVLDFRTVSHQQFSKPKRSVVHMKLGEESFDLVDYLENEGQEIPRNLPSNNSAFEHIAIVVSDMDKAYERVRAHVSSVSLSPQTIPLTNPAAGGIKAFYFKDPDGHNLELIWFPPGKGDPRWQNHPEKTFLGIDHTAIFVSNTTRSLEFYTKKISLHVAGRSENIGIEQERLSGVAGAHVRITGLRGASGPGIEFLEYLNPTEIHEIQVRPNDLLYWEVNLKDPQIIQGNQETKLIRDPDGHALRLFN